jgi:hypothetical protein
LQTSINNGGEMALGWANEGTQGHLSGSADESEPSLGWNNNGMHLQLAAGFSGGDMGESDGDCGTEDDDPGGGNVEDEGEPDYTL